LNADPNATTAPLDRPTGDRGARPCSSPWPQRPGRRGHWPPTGWRLRYRL